MNQAVKKIRNTLLLSIVPLFLLFFCTACINRSQPQQPNQPKVRNIILLIGDGMGVSQLYAGYTANKGKLNITRLPYVGLQKTNSSDNYITDSAASGTAMSCGKKTKNGMIGMGPDSTRLVSILEIAEKHGLATGLVSTSAITHATPASFIAHNASRGNLEAIAGDFLKTDIEVFIGGGKDHFADRKDGLNLIDSLKAKGYEVLEDMNEIKSFSGKKLAALTAGKHNPKYTENRGDLLPVATRTALETLSKNDRGFFLMVEGSQIDWGGHANDDEYIVQEVLDFDKAVGIAMDYAEKDGETLVIVTSDHETGGFAVLNGDFEKGKVKGGFTTGGHTGIWVPVFATGPESDAFAGVYENTDIFHKMKAAYGF